MHRFQSKSSIHRFRFVAILLCIRALLMPFAILLLIYSFVIHMQQLTITALILGGASILLLVLQWITAQRTRCPLCMTPVLAHKDCSKHRSARKLLGSYRLKVAVAVLSKGRFHCPYCHEPSALELRNRLR
jgi:cytochrome bd-type quinol oxidase subunit 1